MIRQIFNFFAVTAALLGAAVVSTMLLEVPLVQDYLGVAAPTGGAWLSLEVAVLAGLVVDGLRLLAVKWWHKSLRLQHDLQDVFRNSLA